MRRSPPKRLLPKRPRHHVLLLGGFTAALLLGGCGEESGPPGPPPASSLYVVNSLGETLDRIDLATGSVEHDVLLLGNGPNDLVAESDGARLWVANSADNDVWGIDAVTLDIGPVIDLGSNQNPYRLALLDDGRVAVTNWLDGNLALLDPVGGKVDDRRPIGRTPEAILAGGSRLLVTAVGYDFPTGRFGPGKVYALDARARGAGPVDSATVPTNPQDLLLDAAGRLHVVCTGNYGAYEPATVGAIRVLDAATLDSLGAIELGATPGAAVLAGGHVYVSAFFGGLLKYDAASLDLERGTDDPILDVPGLSGMAFDAETNRLYVAGFDEDLVYVIDTTADTLVTAWEVGDGPIALELGREAAMFVPTPRQRVPR